MEIAEKSRSALDRRRFLAFFTSLGLGSTLLPGALAAVAGQSEKITTQMMAQAEKIAGLEFTEAERAELVKGLNTNRRRFIRLRALKMANKVALPLAFNPLPSGRKPPEQASGLLISGKKVSRPSNLEEVAFWPLTALAGLIKTRQVTSTELTRMYLGRLKKYNQRLNCVVTLTRDLALEQAARADSEIAEGHYRGPLHGIPWGAKDLFAVKDYPTSWGFEAYKNRVFDYNATVVDRLAKAGAVLTAKLSLGELATGDRWWRGRTRNPWNPALGSGGSSAGSASAVAAGLVGFALGTETNGSLIMPAMTCGISALRPTYGRVSRYGAMTVAWSYDKVGPMCRSAQDCAVVLKAISGPDDLDRSVLDLEFGWRTGVDVSRLKIGYIKGLFDVGPGQAQIAHILKAHQQAFEKMRELGFEFKELSGVNQEKIIELTRLSSLGMMVEAAAAHEELGLISGRKVFAHSRWGRWLRGARYIPAVELIQSYRARQLLMEEVARVMDRVDVLLARIIPSGLQGNLTGHPELTIPHGLWLGLPVNIILTGQLFGEADLISLADRYQQATDYHLAHPKLDRLDNRTGAN